MNYISIDILEKYNCCQDQVKLFKELFPSGIVEFNSLREAELLAKKYSNKFDFSYLGCEVFGFVYSEGTKPNYQAYKGAKKTHLDAYEEATKPYWDAYEESEKTPCNTYTEAEKPLWKAYKEAIKPHLDAYLEAEKPLWKAYLEAEAQVFAKLWYELEE